MQKRQTLLKGFALLKNDITGSELAFGIANILQITGFGFKISYTNLHCYWSILQASASARFR